jgi:ubiquinone/menaquinone biosynthesis C-methylase UbiE
MEPTSYAAAWTREESLDSLNRRIHDGVSLEQLADRARGYRDQMFEVLYPFAPPKEGERVLEVGSGVGWIMQAMLEKFPIGEITGLDISENMVRRAQERFSDPRSQFVLYDGFHFPFSDDYFPVIYSCAALQHIEKHVAFLLMREIYRVLAPQGHAILHFLSINHMSQNNIPYEQECWNIINNTETHWHFYYSFDELFIIFSELIGVDDLDIWPDPSFSSFFVHFSKGTQRKFLRENLPKCTYKNRFNQK